MTAGRATCKALVCLLLLWGEEKRPPTMLKSKVKDIDSMKVLQLMFVRRRGGGEDDIGC